ncbi:serine protease nudel [Arctopsyche grandis]|uniref:serine protease nudel n=1 Tax=Arctopsyche grandis TaxID=121162 RepID=UPI00406D8553
MLSSPKSPTAELQNLPENVSINLPNTRQNSRSSFWKMNIIQTLTNSFIVLLIIIVTATSVAHIIIAYSRYNVSTSEIKNENDHHSKIATDLYPRNYNDLQHAVLITASPNSEEDFPIDDDYSSFEYNPNWDLDTNLQGIHMNYLVRKKRNPSPMPELLNNYNVKCKLNSNSKDCQNMLHSLKKMGNDLKNYVDFAINELTEKSHKNSNILKDTPKEKRSSNFTDTYNTNDSLNRSEISTTIEVINENVQNSSQRSSANIFENINSESSADSVKLNMKSNEHSNEESISQNQKKRSSDSSSNSSSDHEFSTDKYLFTEVSSVISEHIDLNFSETPQNQSIVGGEENSPKSRSNEEAVKITESNSDSKKIANKTENNKETVVDHLTVPPLPLINEDRRPGSIVQSRGSNSESNSRIIQVHHGNSFTSPKATNFDDNIQGSVTSENMKAASQVIVSSGTQPANTQCYYVPTNQFGGIFTTASPKILTQDISPRANDITGNGLPIPMPVHSQPQYFIQPNFQQQYVMTRNPVYGNIGYQQAFVPSGQAVQMSLMCIPVQMAHMNQVPFVSAVPELLPRSTVSSSENEYNNNNNHPNTNYNNHEDNSNHNHEDNSNHNHEDNHISSHYRNAEMMSNKIYGQHEFESFNGETSCESNSKMCVSDGKCLNADQWCDGNVDCEDGSDEGHCPCKSRIHKSRICDGFYDCPLGEDELGCFNCKNASFSCNEWSRRKSTSNCFSIEERCDGINQCSNGKDEQDCTMLHNDLDHHPTFCISHSKGFLHKNIKGKWYPVCQNPFKWAAEACYSEMGNLDMPPYIQQKSPKTFHGKYVQETSAGNIEYVDDCSGLAVYVTCMSVKCGIRSNSISQSLRDTGAEEDDELFGRKKRHSAIYTPIVAAGFYDDYSDYVNFDESYGVYEDTIAPPPPPYIPNYANIHSEDFKNFQEMYPRYNDYRPETYDDQDTMPNNPYNFDQRGFHPYIPNSQYDNGIYSVYEHPPNGYAPNYDYNDQIESYDEKARNSESTDNFDAIRGKRGEGRVVGGKSSAPAAWPWVVAIYRNGAFHCGGVIISDQWIMSAAHCVSKYWHFYYEVQAGMLRRFSFSPQEQIRAVTHIIQHRLYDKKSMINDMSLMFMDEPLYFNKWIRPACLPNIESAGKEWLWGPPPGVLCTAVGWGATMEHGPDPDHMREVEVPIMSNCKHSEDRQGQEICAGVSKGGRDACQGDSGGPFLCKNPNDHKQWYIAGIVSHGEGCARAGEPGVYTRVSIFKDWIRDNMVENNFPSQTPKTTCPGFSCVFGVPRCLAKQLRCDKTVDCLGGEDEVNCHKEIVGLSLNDTDYLDEFESNIDYIDSNTTVSTILNGSISVTVSEHSQTQDFVHENLTQHSKQPILNRNAEEHTDKMIISTGSSVVTELPYQHSSLIISDKIENVPKFRTNVDQSGFNTNSEPKNFTHSSKQPMLNKTAEEQTESPSTMSPSLATELLNQNSLLNNTTDEIEHSPQSSSNVDQSGLNTKSESDNFTHPVEHPTLNKTAEEHTESFHITTEKTSELKSSNMSPNLRTLLPNQYSFLNNTPDEIEHSPQSRSNLDQSGLNTKSEPEKFTHSSEQSLINRNAEDHIESFHIMTEETFKLKSSTTSPNLVTELPNQNSLLNNTTDEIEHGTQFRSNMNQSELNTNSEAEKFTNSSEQSLINRKSEDHTESFHITTEETFELKSSSSMSPNLVTELLNQNSLLNNTTDKIEHGNQFRSNVDQSELNTNSEPEKLTHAFEQSLINRNAADHTESFHITREETFELKSKSTVSNLKTKFFDLSSMLNNTDKNIDYESPLKPNLNQTKFVANISHENLSRHSEGLMLGGNAEKHAKGIATMERFELKSSSNLETKFHDLDSYLRNTDRIESMSDVNQKKFTIKNTSDENHLEQPVLSRNAEEPSENSQITTKESFESNTPIISSTSSSTKFEIPDQNLPWNSSEIIEYEPKSESESDQDLQLNPQFGTSVIENFEGSGDDPNETHSSTKTSIFIVSNERERSVQSSNTESEIVSQSFNESLSALNNSNPLRRNESLTFNATKIFPNKTEEVVFKNIAFNGSEITNGNFSNVLQNDTNGVTTERQLNLNDSNIPSPDLFITDLPSEKKLEDNTDRPLIVQPDEFLDETNPSTELTINTNTENVNGNSPSPTNPLFNQIDQNLEKEDRELSNPVNIILPTKTSTVQPLDENEPRGLNPLFNGADTESHINKKELIPDPKNQFSSSNTNFIFPEDMDEMPIISNSTISSNRTLRPIYAQHFECKGIKQRIPSWKRCDRSADCEDGSDEIHCSCLDYLAFRYSSALCDGYVDCSDGSDERDCYSCALTHFQCKTSRNCIPNEKVCDRRKDCKYGEDEVDCFALYIGNQMQFDKDTRPHLNSEGIVSLRTKNTWSTVCEEHWTNEKKIEISNKICSYLGFGGVIDFKEVDPSLESSNHRNQTEAHNFSFRNHASSVSEMILPQNCKALYVRCMVKHIGNVESHLAPVDLFDIDVTTLSMEYQDMYLWPWIGQVYVEGRYKCLGVLVHLSWILVENNCWHGLSLEDTFATVVLGTKRSIPDIESPYEQIIRVDGVKILSFSTVTLLHLHDGVYISRYVKPIPMPDFNMDHINEDDKCLAAGLDVKGNPVSIFLTPVIADCGLTNRCFRRETSPQHCKENTHNAAYNENIPAWSGILVCHRKSNWYPAATYSEPNGICGFTGIIAMPNLSQRKKDIKLSVESHIMTVRESQCVGVRCKLGQCIPPVEICDEIPNCQEGTDENFENCEFKRTYCLKSPHDPACGSPVSQLKCNNGHYIPKLWFANNINECGDNSDEPEHLTCFSYLALTSPEKICDGVRHCLDKTDEDPKYCYCYAKNAYKCPNTDFCVPFDFICDGENDCPGGEDEFVCAALRSHDSKKGSGEVIMNKHGIWHPRCFSKPDFTKFELEEICGGLGFRSGHVKKLKPPLNHQNDLFIQVAVDSFTNVSFPRAVISMRKGNSAYAWAEIIPKTKICYRLYIECL